jgi:hypothetical protein
VLEVSAATIDRLLAPTRLSVKGRQRASAKPAVRRSVPVRTFSDWHNPPPGFMEIDLVAHSGESMAGSFVHTLVLTDIASEWTECVALPFREAAVVVATIRRLQPLLPFKLLGLDSDNGSEFLNETMLAYCREAGLEFTRSRPYRKNDQAWVEQKNGAVVRRLVGYQRLEGADAVEGLNRLYAASRLFRELLPALLQACVEDASRGSRYQAVPPAGDALCEAAGVGCRSGGDQGATAGGPADAGSASPPGRGTHDAAARRSTRAR